MHKNNIPLLEFVFGLLSLEEGQGFIGYVWMDIHLYCICGCGVHLCFADGWAAPTSDGGDWVEFEFDDHVGELKFDSKASYTMNLY